MKIPIIFILILYPSVIFSQLLIDDKLEINGKLLIDLNCQEVDSIDKLISTKINEMEKLNTISSTTESRNYDLEVMDSLMKRSENLFNLRYYKYCEFDKEKTNFLINKFNSYYYWEDFTLEELDYLNKYIKFKRDSFYSRNKYEIVNRKKDIYTHEYLEEDKNLYDSLNLIINSLKDGIFYLKTKKNPEYEVDSLYEKIFKVKRNEKPEYVYFISTSDTINFSEINEAKFIVITGDNFFVPKEISEFDSLLFLYLDVFKELEISSEIIKFENLASISIPYNNLKKIPEFIYNTNSLLDLDIYVRNKNSISNKICHLTNLERITIAIRTDFKLINVSISGF